MREPIQTERLILRDVTETDAELLVDLDSDPEVMRYIPGPRLDAAWYRERIRTFYLPMQAHPWHGMWIVLDSGSGDFLGWVFIRPSTAYIHAREMNWTDPNEVEVGYRYRKAAWGRGVATEAAAPLVELALADPATRGVVGCAQSDNAPSIRVLEKLGLRCVGEVVLPDATIPTIKLALAVRPVRIGPVRGA